MLREFSGKARRGRTMPLRGYTDLQKRFQGGKMKIWQWQ
jgi:hypothetical protein